MCFCTFENVKKVDFVLLKMDFFWNFNSLCDPLSYEVPSGKFGHRFFHIVALDMYENCFELDALRKCAFEADFGT